MEQRTVALGGSPGQVFCLKSLHFGRAGVGPKAVIQAALHADEMPPLLVAQVLRRELLRLEAAGAVLGEVVLLPLANPVGLAQRVLGQPHGRFDLRDGVNFNRLLPDVTDAAALALRGLLGPDAGANVALVRAALRSALAAQGASGFDHPVAALKHGLLLQAIDADVVLDLHCDEQAVMHLYGLTPQADACAELGALLGAQAVLLATESGDLPFDEACSRPWLELQARLAPAALPLACFATTVELRGHADTSHALAEQDAQALLAFLQRRGVLAGTPPALPAARCQPTPLAASEPVAAPHAGVLVFHVEPGARVQAGQVLADVVDIDSGAVTPVHTQSAGLLYARTDRRWVQRGQRLAKVAGTTLLRQGKLLGA